MYACFYMYHFIYIIILMYMYICIYVYTVQVAIYICTDTKLGCIIVVAPKENGRDELSFCSNLPCSPFS